MQILLVQSMESNLWISPRGLFSLLCPVVFLLFWKPKKNGASP